MKFCSLGYFSLVLLRVQNKFEHGIMSNWTITLDIISWLFVKSHSVSETGSISAISLMQGERGCLLWLDF